MTTIAHVSAAKLIATHTPIYRDRRPHYQTEMLTSRATVWQGHRERVLDVGGGTGVIAQAIQEFLPVGGTTAIDVVDRYFDTLSVETMTFGGIYLPFEESALGAVTINNVMHHIPISARAKLLRELRRVVAGPLYIKDHVARSWLDRQRLTLLDAIGNVPFGGQVDADYLTPAAWDELARTSGYTIGQRISGTYRSGLMNMLFPNALEVTMRFDPR